MIAKTYIIDYLKDKSWVGSWELEDQARHWGYMSSNISRRCRELVRAGVLEHRPVKKGRVITAEFRLKGQPEYPKVIIEAEPNKLFEIKRERILM